MSEVDISREAIAIAVMHDDEPLYALLYALRDALDKAEGDLEFKNTQLDNCSTLLRERFDTIARQQRAIERKDAALNKVATWLEKCADVCGEQAKDTRFVTISEASKRDAKNYRATAKDVRKSSAYTGTPE